MTVGDAADGPAPGLPWDVTVTLAFRPDLATLTDHERRLGDWAAAHGGRGDGWFCERIVRDEA